MYSAAGTHRALQHLLSPRHADGTMYKHHHVANSAFVLVVHFSFDGNILGMLICMHDAAAELSTAPSRSSASAPPVYAAAAMTH